MFGCYVTVWFLGGLKFEMCSNDVLGGILLGGILSFVEEKSVV